MPNYEKPTKTLMAEWARDHLKPGQTFGRSDVVQWFAQHYPKTKRGTVTAHVDGMSVNNTVRKHHPAIRPGGGYDLFFKLGSNEFRLWNSETDPPPYYKGTEQPPGPSAPTPEDDDDNDESDGITKGSREFAFEQDLQNYLVRNLSAIEPGLRVYEEDGITGVEYPAGTRRIDILALDRDDAFVVIELKVARGYDRVIGQLLRYMGWVQQNMAPTRPVRGMIVASEITDDLKLAALQMPGIRLIEYELSFELRSVDPNPKSAG